MARLISSASRMTNCCTLHAIEASLRRPTLHNLCTEINAQIDAEIGKRYSGTVQGKRWYCSL